MIFEPSRRVLSRYPITNRLLLICNLLLLLAQVVGAGLFLLKGNSELERARTESNDAQVKLKDTEARVESQQRATEAERQIACQRLENLKAERANLEELVRTQRRNLAAEHTLLKSSAQYTEELIRENKVLSALKLKQAESDAKAADLRRDLVAAELRTAQAKKQFEQTVLGSTVARKEVEWVEKKVKPSAEAILAVVRPGMALRVRGAINAGVMTHDVFGELPSSSIFAKGATVTVEEVTVSRFLIVGPSGQPRGWLVWSDYHKFFDNPRE